MLRKISATLCGLMLCASLATAAPIIENAGNTAVTDDNPKFSVTSMSGMTAAMSMYTVWNTNGEKQVVFSVQKFRSAETMNSFEQTLLMIWNSPNQSYILGKKGIPTLVCVTNGTETAASFKSKMLGTELSTYHINRKMTGEAVAADEVFVELTQKDGSKVRVRIPSDVVKQWNDTAIADLKELRKNM